MKSSLALLLALAPLVHAQLTPEQKLFDMQSLGAIYAKRYGPYEWKKTLFNFNLFEMQPWLDRAAATTNDLDFYEVMVDYVSSLNDSHDAYILPSNFAASLSFTTDIYDGKVLIDSINRTRLPVAQFPFVIGDEVVSVDGSTAAELIAKFTRYVRQGNPRSTARRAAAMIAVRRQSRHPHANEIADAAAVVVQRQTTGALETYTIPWVKSGIAITQVGPIGPPFGTIIGNEQQQATILNGDPIDPLTQLQIAISPMPLGELNSGALAPLFVQSLPSNFVRRLGADPFADFFYSGIFQAGGKRIGFLRIPTYNPTSTGIAYAQLQSEIAYLQDNTDGLIIDQMRNPGGLLCYGEAIVANLTPAVFQPMGYQIRATWEYVAFFYANSVINNQYKLLSDAMLEAYNNNRGMTETVPLCTSNFQRPPATVNGRLNAYTKPLIMLIDEFSTSTADSVPAMLQDNQRGLLVGTRTNGAGGSNSLNIGSWQVGAYSEGTTGVTLSLMVRKNSVQTDGYPVTNYIENVGVTADIQLEYMTRDNLLQGGKPFFDAATAVLLKQLP